MHGCTTLSNYCPVKFPDQSTRKYRKIRLFISILAQAIPLVTYIDESVSTSKTRNAGFVKVAL